MSKGNFLIVEDEFVVAENLRTELVSMDYAVVGLASSGEKAIELARREKPDMALMDIKLIGGMDGIETAIHLRKLDVPVLFLTAFADESFLERAKLAEPLGYLVKPYDRKGLRAGIEMAHYKARMERLLKESESRFRSMFENSPVAYLALDASGSCLDLNSVLCELLGNDQEELIGKNFVELWPSETRRQYPELFLKLKDHGRLQIELELMRKDHTPITVLFEGRVQRGMEGEFLRMHCILHNITERKRAEEERRQLTRRRQQVQKAESLGRMAGAIAHHFNNQLQVVMGSLEMAMDDLPRGANTLATLNNAMKAARKGAEVSGLMLTYLGQTPGKREPLDLSEVCIRSLPMICATMPKKVVLETDLQTPGPTVNSDANQIQQILTHLITNAWEAAGKNQEVIGLTVKTVSQANIPALNRFPIDWQPREGAYACLEVKDAGCGIACKDIEKLFDPFFTTKFTGRGLGMAVVLGMVGAHGGGITVESEPVRGSVFRVFLPVSTEEIPLQQEKTVPAPNIPTAPG
ncbi:MAG: PAS domain S-box protein [Deltaproteobacteria bacterium]|jgi:two-component system, cell cycle sensor histidine kinase and response regulator CckA